MSLPKVTWWQRKATLHFVFACDGESGEPQLSLASDDEVFLKWGKYDFSAAFAKAVDHQSAKWTIGKLTKKGTCELMVRKQDGGAKYWSLPFAGGKRKNVAPNWENWMDEEDEEAMLAQAAAPPPPPPAEEEDNSGMPKRKKAGWRPTSEDWERVVCAHKPLTDTLAGRKIVVSCSSKSADSRYAKELERALAAEGAECRCITKFPIKSWVEACKYTAEVADFAVILQSANYEAGNYSAAEFFLLKEANVKFVMLNIDDPQDDWHCRTAADAVAFVRRSLPLDQRARVQTNYDPITWGFMTMDNEGREAYAKIQKVWTKKEETAEVHMTMGAQVGTEAARTACKPAKAESSEMQELKAMLYGGAPSQRNRR
eukprot:270899-Prymnesium_polylepis.1